MTIQQLRYVTVICDEGSLNKASEQLYIAQPSLTSALQELEKEIGITVFNRSGRGVSPTNDGLEFIRYAREVLSQYDNLLEKYGKSGNLKKKFGISTQHYSFAVTRDVIDDVALGKSEIGILYLNDFNRKPLEKLLRSNSLIFTPLTECSAYVYLWKGHPLAEKEKIRFEDLKEYPCLSFEQGDKGSFYYAEEILSTSEYPKTIKATDRATMLNLMIGLNGYTLCSGVISEELNGSDYLAVPFEPDDDTVVSNMVIGYISKKNLLLSHIAQLYVKELKQYLCSYQESHK